MTRIDRIRWMVVAVILGRFCSINSISIQGDSWEVSDWERLDQSIVGPNDYTGFRVSHLCLDSDCEHLELNVTGRHERGADLFMFQMVRSRLFDSNLTHQYPELNLHCYYQHYNPLMGLNGYFRNGLRFSQKIAYAIICPNEKAFLGESRIMFNLPRSWQPKVQNEFVADVQLLLYRESNEWRSTYHEYSNRDICASSPSNRTTRPPNALEEMITKLQDKHLGRNTRFVKPSKQVWDVLRQNGAYLRDEESYNNVPYVKLFLYFEQVNNPIYNRDTLSDAFHTLYLTDLVLRRLPVRIVVVDILFVAKFTTKTCFGFKELKTMDEQVLQVGSQLKDANFVVIQANYESNCIHWMNQALHLYPIGSRVNLVFTRTNWRHIICDTFEMLNRIHLYLFPDVKALTGTTDRLYSGSAPFMSKPENGYTTSYLEYHWAANWFFEVESLMQKFHYLLKPPPEYSNNPESYPICGDGVLQPGEECDCMPIGCLHVDFQMVVRDNMCCNRKTCKLRANSKCGTGECCNIKTCQPYRHMDKVLCRKSKRECDLEERCLGNSEHCPPDLFEADGTECNKGSGYCYNQFCFGNTTDYCRSYFNDPNAKVAEDKMNLNTKADPMHNCGWPAQDSLPSECAIENVQCGSMHCQLSQRFVNATQTYSIGYHGPGNVLFARPFPDGVKCKTDHLCIDNECLPRQSLPQMACPDDCNNAGRCVYGGHCYCNPEQDYNDPVSCYNTFLLRWNDIAIIIVITSMVIVSIAIMISRCRQSVNAEKQKMAAEMRREARSKSSTKTKPRSGRRNRATTNQKPSSKLSAPRTTANAPETPVAAAPVPTPAPARPNVFVDQPTSSPVKKSNYILQMFNKKKTIGSGLAEEAFVPLSKKSKTITTVDSCT